MNYIESSKPVKTLAMKENDGITNVKKTQKGTDLKKEHVYVKTKCVNNEHGSTKKVENKPQWNMKCQ